MKKRSKKNVMDIDKGNGQDSESPWGPRIPVTVDVATGVMSAGETTRPIDVSGDVSLVLSTYLSMVYELRSQPTGVIPLRKEDVLALANAFEMDETAIAERLARLMHCDDLQTHRFIQMIKKGRVLVPASMVAAGTLLAATLTVASTAQVQNPKVDTKSRANVEIVTTTLPVPTTAPVTTKEVLVDVGDAIQVQRVFVAGESTPSTPEIQSTSTQGNIEDVGPGEVVIGEGISVSRDD